MRSGCPGKVTCSGERPFTATACRLFNIKDLQRFFVPLPVPRPSEWNVLPSLAARIQVFR